MSDMVRIIDITQNDNVVIINNDTGEVLDTGNLSLAYAAPRERVRITDSPVEAKRYSLAFGIPLYVDLDDTE